MPRRSVGRMAVPGHRNRCPVLLSRPHPAAGYHGGGGQGVLFEERLIYYPARGPEAFREVEALRARDPQAPCLEDCALTASDGVRLHAWWCGPRTGPAPAALLLLHGNAGNMAWRYDR